MSDRCCCNRFSREFGAGTKFRLNDIVHMSVGMSGAFCGPWWKHDLIAKDARIEELEAAIVELERYTDAIVCYASTISEHDANRVVRLFRDLKAGISVNALLAARERIEALDKLLRRHHQHHQDYGTIGLPDGQGGWIEMDNAAEYGDSTLCEDTIKALWSVKGESSDE